MLDYALFGLDPRGHHLTNNLLHAINTFLVAILIYQLVNLGLKKKDSIKEQNSNTLFALTASVVTALFFGLHPLRVESVVWISERKDLLCALFFLLSALAYLAYSARAKKGRDRG